VAPDAPAVLIAFVAQPVVAEDLGVEVVRLEGRVVHVRLGPLEEEEAVVVDALGAAVEAEKDGLVDAGVIVDELFCISGRAALAGC
jgi:predicted transcriptional regulator